MLRDENQFGPVIQGAGNDGFPPEMVEGNGPHALVGVVAG